MTPTAAGQAYSLYFMDPGELEPVELLQGVVEPQRPAWSPDSRTLAFGGTIDGEPGTWIFDTATGDLTRFADIHPLWLAWSPSGDRIAAVVPKGGDPAEDETELVVYDAGELGDRPG